MVRVGDALEQRGGHLAIGRLDADGLEFRLRGSSTFGGGARAHAVAS